MSALLIIWVGLSMTLGMARGIPRPSILEVPDLFSLLDSPRNRFYNSSAPRFLAKIWRGPRKYRISFLSTSKMKISENFQQFVKIFLFLFLFFKITDHFLVLLPNIPNFKIWIQCWKFFFDFLFDFFFWIFGGFSGFLR